MADVEKKMKVRLDAQDNTRGAFKSLGENVSKLESGTGKLSGSLAKLGAIGASLWAGSKIIDFFKSSVEAAAEAQKVQAQLVATLQSTGFAAGVTADEMIRLSKALQKESTYSDEAILSAQNLLLTFTKIKKDTMPDAIRAVLDMSTVMGGDLKSSALQVGRALQDPTIGITALRRSGVSFSEAQIEVIKNLVETGRQAEAQRLIIKELNKEFGGSAAAAMNTYAGRVAVVKNNWDDLKELIGNAVLPVIDESLKILIERFNQTGDSAEDASVKMGSSFQSGFLKFLAATNNLVRSFGIHPENGIFGLIGFDFKEAIEKTKVDFETINKMVADDLKKALDKSTGLPAVSGAEDDLAESASKAADSFTNLSKSIVSAFQDQAKAINDLKKSMDDLDQKLDEDLNKSNEKYKTDVKNLAKAAQEKKNEIDKQIADERDSMSKGWQNRIRELEAEKSKEQAIIDKANGVVINLQNELSKDEFDSLRESHEKDVIEMRSSAEEKKAEIERETADREKFLTDTQTKIKQPGFFSQTVAEGSSFLGAIGAGGIQTSLNFNFMNAVAGDDGIKKIIEDTIKELDRQATLKGVGGK